MKLTALWFTQLGSWFQVRCLSLLVQPLMFVQLLNQKKKEENKTEDNEKKSPDGFVWAEYFFPLFFLLLCNMFVFKPDCRTGIQTFERTLRVSEKLFFYPTWFVVVLHCVSFLNFRLDCVYICGSHCVRLTHAQSFAGVFSFWWNCFPSKLLNTS